MLSLAMTSVFIIETMKSLFLGLINIINVRICTSKNVYDYHICTDADGMTCLQREKSN